MREARTLAHKLQLDYQVEHLVAVDQMASEYWYKSAYRQRVARHQPWSKGQEL